MYTYISYSHKKDWDVSMMLKKLNNMHFFKKLIGIKNKNIFIFLLYLKIF